MNKAIRGFLLLAALWPGQAALAANRAVEININSLGAGFDAAAYQTVRQVVGHAVGAGLIDTFQVRGYGREGGFSACAEVAASNTQGTGLAAFVRQLRSIRPDAKTTAYSVVPVPSCANDAVVCTADVKLCPNGSYVSRVPPSCQFAACPAK